MSANALSAFAQQFEALFLNKVLESLAESINAALEKGHDADFTSEELAKMLQMAKPKLGALNLGGVQSSVATEKKPSKNTYSQTLPEDGRCCVPVSRGDWAGWYCNKPNVEGTDRCKTHRDTVIKEAGAKVAKPPTKKASVGAFKPSAFKKAEPEPEPEVEQSTAFDLVPGDVLVDEPSIFKANENSVIWEVSASNEEGEGGEYKILGLFKDKKTVTALTPTQAKMWAARGFESCSAEELKDLGFSVEAVKAATPLTKKPPTMPNKKTPTEVSDE